MKVGWAAKRATVRQVYETLREHRTIAYTTVMTMMKILEDKGYLKKVLVDRAHVYQPVKPRQQVISADQVVRLAARQVDAGWVAESIDGGVDFCAQSAARAPDRLVLAGFFWAPALC